ncbi:MAG: hypothetical protein EOP53_19035 [Sphingobacteriales bacterium]|nr:MAG: hypothetical protein EOP53_19035 [Sphingobacteriales bacterium]
MIIKFVILSTFIFCSSFLYGQNGVGTFEGDSSCYALKFVKKGRNFKERLRMDTYSKSGFYMYENYFYHMRWKGSERYHLSKIIKLSKDSMQLTTAFNEAAAAKAGNSYDTVSIPVYSLVATSCPYSDKNPR